MNVVAFARAKQGTGASRRLRNSGRTPGIIYGAAAEPQLIEVDHNTLWYALKKEAFHASVLELDLDGAKSQVLLRDVQYHPYKQLVLHIDFQRVDANTALTMKVPVHFSGAEESPAVKLEKLLVTPVVTEIEVRCMPKDLPEFISVDLSKLEKGATIRLKDIALPKGVKLASQQTNPALVSVVAPAAEEPAEGEAPAAA
ncbi:50S ribosomal protein L25/general stress protein Ctc [Comamonas piscis]|uniref:Large ribosomal subunit protein bL25 n=1 Tax=Comamonas piscis TaxID=1562974 RepID=A0A7G5EM84_9BURK|nr:50S ribosomal protein L25/general stress protein Ctc [Comamonas piscis]QMV75109.1 50S ribosomal protein L25/general stress protein Ctc [Comamonas piscis]WSO33594.1 50S ribosomal protein L25/general stress protein Ctc [Comamonas piscis]